jgi:type II secretion system protein H
MMSFGHRKRGGFTLIELICVMAVMAVVMAISAPALSGFFRGRSLHEQSRRFLALTRHARSVAVSYSAPVELWVDTSQGSYGLNIQANYGTEDAQSLEYHLGDNQEFDVDTQFLDKDGKATLLFYPDGLMDEMNPDKIVLWEGDKDEIVIRKTNSGIGYVLDEGSNE